MQCRDLADWLVVRYSHYYVIIGVLSTVSIDSWGYEVQVSDLQRALAARGAECERQQAELHRLQDAFQAETVVIRETKQCWKWSPLMVLDGWDCQ